MTGPTMEAVTTMAMPTELPRSANGVITATPRMPARLTAFTVRAGSSAACLSVPALGTAATGVADIGAAATGIADSTAGVTATDAAMDTDVVMAMDAVDTAMDAAESGIVAVQSVADTVGEAPIAVAAPSPVIAAARAASMVVPSVVDSMAVAAVVASTAVVAVTVVVADTVNPHG